MQNASKTDLKRVDVLTEGDIDTSDIPLLGEEFIETSRWWKPGTPSSVLLDLDPATFACFQNQGSDYTSLNSLDSLELLPKIPNDFFLGQLHHCSNPIDRT